MLQAMRRKARSLGLQQFLSDNFTARKVYAMTMSLPLLPQELIEEGFYLIQEYAVAVLTEMQVYLDYVKNTWIEGNKVF